MSDALPLIIHDKAVIISTGDEIMTGQLQDSNACWLSAALIEAGIMTVEHCAVGDVLDDLVAIIRRAASRAPLIIMSGGLGPTDGDLTREAICRATSDTLILDESLRADLAAKLTQRGREVTPRQQRQSHRPSRADPLPNAFGTAPGLHTRAESGGADIYCLPGPPGELRPMFLAQVLPKLHAPSGHAVLTRLIHIVGIAEADCVGKLGTLTQRDRVPLVGITASGGILTIRIRDEGAIPGAAERVNDTEAHIRAILGDHALPTPSNTSMTGVEHLAAHILTALRPPGQPPRTLAVVESCTGGMLGEMLTAIPGSSSVFLGGFITYANTLKESLGVNHDTLARYGAVSSETAREMAQHALARSGADFSLAITGVAGPDGGTPAKPVGTVHIGIASHMPGKADAPQIHSRHFLFTGDREDIRRRACVSALTMLHFHLTRAQPGVPHLLWEAP